MVKDRARPFSRKHARYWLTAAGGMVLIMAINLALGFWLLRSGGKKPPPPQYRPIESLPTDAADDASRAAPPP